MERRLCTALVAACATVSLAACSGSPPTTPRSIPRHVPGPVVITHPGGVVTVLTHAGLGPTLDPADAYQRDTLSIDSSLLTRSLTQYRYDPRRKETYLVPDLATDLGSHNDNFTKWRFYVRAGVRFQDGEPVTARNVAWGIRRCLDATTFPTGPCQHYLNPNLVGGRSYQGPYTAPHQRLTSVRAKGHEITLLFRKPFPDLPYLAALPAMGPVPLGSRSHPATYRTHPLATGPYRVVSYRPGRRLVLTRNPQWDRRTDPVRTQYPDGFDFRAGLSARRIDRELLADRNRAETTLTYDDVSAADYPEWARSARHRLVFGGTPCTTYLAPDNHTVTDPRVRRALSWGYPYRAVIRAEGDIPDVTVVPATNLMPPGIAGRVAHDSIARRGFDRDPARARSLLRKAHAVGFPIRFSYDRHSPTSVRVKDELVHALRASGFTPHAEPTFSGTSLTGTPPGPVVNLRTVTRCGDWPTGGQWLPPVFGSAHPHRTGSIGTNLEAFSRPAVDRRVAAIERMPIEKQAAQWSRLDNDTMGRWFPVVPISYGGVAMAHGSRIRGMADDIVHAMPTWSRIWVAP